jgi:CheY-like chemotaxis protein
VPLPVNMDAIARTIAQTIAAVERSCELLSRLDANFDGRYPVGGAGQLHSSAEHLNPPGDTRRQLTSRICERPMVAVASVSEANYLVEVEQRHATGGGPSITRFAGREAKMSVASPTLVGKRVLIVEDEALVAFMLEDFLVEFGCIPVGPCNTLAKALEAVGAETFDLAVLDVNLNGEKVYPVAYALAERHIPFLFVSGYGENALLRGHSWRVCKRGKTPGSLRRLANRTGKSHATMAEIRQAVTRADDCCTCVPGLLPLLRGFV